ncbi:MAG: LysR substrate-binding domain-containing protein [Comamonadaceae bacterium]|nr:LysR substrate-binding domain-containing protein [Comamonadaceae bacterium]
MEASYRTVDLVREELPRRGARGPRSVAGARLGAVVRPADDRRRFRRGRAPAARVRPWRRCAREPLLGEDVAWEDWFAEAGLTITVRPVASFNDAGLMLQAAEQGLGIAISREMLAADALVAGRLVKLSPVTITHPDARPYHFVYPPHLAQWPPLVALREWLTEEIAASQRALREAARPRRRPARPTRRRGTGIVRATVQRPAFVTVLGPIVGTGTGGYRMELLADADSTRRPCRLRRARRAAPGRDRRRRRRSRGARELDRQRSRQPRRDGDLAQRRDRRGRAAAPRARLLGVQWRARRDRPRTGRRSGCAARQRRPRPRRLDARPACRGATPGGASRPWCARRDGSQRSRTRAQRRRAACRRWPSSSASCPPSFTPPRRSATWCWTARGACSRPASRSHAARASAPTRCGCASTVRSTARCSSCGRCRTRRSGSPWQGSTAVPMARVLRAGPRARGQRRGGAGDRRARRSRVRATVRGRPLDAHHRDLRVRRGRHVAGVDAPGRRADRDGTRDRAQRHRRRVHDRRARSRRRPPRRPPVDDGCRGPAADAGRRTGRGRARQARRGRPARHARRALPQLCRARGDRRLALAARVRHGRRRRARDQRGLRGAALPAGELRRDRRVHRAVAARRADVRSVDRAPAPPVRAACRSSAAYTLERELSEGGMATIYLARHALLKRRTAIKILKKTIGTDEFAHRFEREVQLVSQLLPPEHGADLRLRPHAAKGQPYYVMEYIDGVTLAGLVERLGPRCRPGG